MEISDLLCLMYILFYLYAIDPLIPLKNLFRITQQEIFQNIAYS